MSAGENGKTPAGAGVVISVDLKLGPDGSLVGMHTGIASVGFTIPESEAARIAGGVQKVLERVLFVRADAPPALQRGPVS